MRARLLCGILAVAASQCSGPASPTPVSGPPDRAAVVDALFFGSGPVADAADPDCPVASVWVSYPRDATVTLVLGATVDASGQRALEQAVADLGSAIAGRFGFAVERSIESDPRPARLQITSADVPASVVQALCSPGGSGCTSAVTREGPLLTGARCVQRIGTGVRLKVHEFGHAVGLCHVDRFRMPSAVMAATAGATPQDRFSDLELDAIRAVYASGLEPGATRADFVRVGLLR